MARTFRVIHHLSYPNGLSINDEIPDEYRGVQYPNIEDACILINRYGRNCLCFKLDIQDAYKIVPIHPSDWELLGFSIDNMFYYDKTLPMGLSYSCQLFEEVSSALHWIAENKLGLVSGIVHMLDDFLFVGPPDYNTCMKDLNKIQVLFKDIGIPIKTSKTVLPCTLLTFLGIEIDSEMMIKRLPEEKIESVKQPLRKHKNKKSITLWELQSIIGLLNFACDVLSQVALF